MKRSMQLAFTALLLALGTASGATDLAARNLTGPNLSGPNLSGQEIVTRAHQAAGGEAWLKAGTNVMRGHATLCRNGNPGACITADRYEMYRVYPTELAKAHAGSGKFRLDAFVGDRVLFQMAFDGEKSYDQKGVVAGPRAETDEGTGFGFSAIRFALEPGFTVTRLTDDQVEGHPSHFVRVTDPSGQTTLFGIDAKDYSIRSVAWLSPKGWHERIYSDFYRVGKDGFLQPGRVRHYYEGVKSVDIRWTSAEIGTAIPDSTFVLGSPR